MRRKPYKEGDWFAVPLDPGYILGRIARVGKRGGILLGYFFSPLHDTLPSVEDTLGLTAADAFNIGEFGDLGLLEEGWPIIHRPETWSRAEWPMPLMGRLNDFRVGSGYCVRYDEDELGLNLGTWTIPADLAFRLPKDGMAGHIYLQKRLRKYFREGLPPYDPTDTKRVYSWFHGLPSAETMAALKPFIDSKSPE